MHAAMQLSDAWKQTQLTSNQFIVSGELIVSKYVAESITMIAGCCYCYIIVIDSATYLLMISSPDINKVAMSLYDINSLYTQLGVQGTCLLQSMQNQRRR